VSFLVPWWLGAWLTICLAGLVPAVLTVLIVYTYGCRRAFCIGAVFPAGIALLLSLAFLLTMLQELMALGYTPWHARNAFLFQACITGAWVWMLPVGLIAALVYLVLRRPQDG
jgi:hypothetical protein